MGRPSPIASIAPFGSVASAETAPSVGATEAARRLRGDAAIAVRTGGPRLGGDGAIG